MRGRLVLLERFNPLNLLGESRAKWEWVQVKGLGLEIRPLGGPQ